MPKFLPLLLLLSWSASLFAADIPRVEVPAPAADATCPVCGMFVAKYPEWIATVRYRDGHLHHFDGAKDLFKYLHNLPKYAPGHGEADIETIAVTDYYDLQRIDARRAWYVIGSDVRGPMGHELVPLASEEEAREFLADHAGRRILRFDEVDAGLPKRLDDGDFDQP